MKEWRGDRLALLQYSSAAVPGPVTADVDKASCLVRTRKEWVAVGCCIVFCAAVQSPVWTVVQSSALLQPLCDTHKGWLLVIQLLHQACLYRFSFL